MARNNPNLQRAADELRAIMDKPKYYAVLRLAGENTLYHSIVPEGHHRASDIMMHSPQPFITSLEAIEWARDNDLDNGGSLADWSPIA